MDTFTFERHNTKTTLPFNPELEGYLYSECKCTYVKFKKSTGDTETQLNFYYKSQNKYIQVLKIERIGGVMRQKENKNIQSYPSNQAELKSIIDGL